MVIDDNESCGSGAIELSSSRGSMRHRRVKLEVYNEVLVRLKDCDSLEVREPEFDDELWAHFNRLPTRYALDVNLERAEDVLTHKRLLHLARDPENRPAIEVRQVQVSPLSHGNPTDSIHLRSQRREVESTHPPLALGSSPNLEALAHEVDEVQVGEGDSSINACANYIGPTHEITFSTKDKPKLLSQLTSLMAEVGLNIQEAHVFSTTDGYSLDVFVVNGWPYEETELLRSALEKEVSEVEKPSFQTQQSSPSVAQHEQLSIQGTPEYLTIPTDGTDVWEINPQLLVVGKKVASGSYGDLYKGTYCSQEVAIKFLKSEHVTAEMQREFAQEVYIMRKVRHKNVVQFIGACTKPPNMCIVTEYMSGGSVHNYLHKQKGTFKLPLMLKIAIDVSKGMNYLHQQNIIHRDLKAANILMDENDVVKVADFGVARVKAQSGIMTAETGTYRWMAPEVIGHKPYDHKADIFSFGVVLWELLTGKLPYEHLTPLQAAVGVFQKELRPIIPVHTHPKLIELLEICWHKNPASRPDFAEIIVVLQQIAKEVQAVKDSRGKEKTSSGFLSVLRRGHH